MNRMKKIFRRKWVIAAVLLVAAGAWWGGSAILKSKEAEGQALQNLQTLPLAKGELTKSLLLSGTIRSQNSRNVYAPSSLKLTEVLVKEGDAVKAGQKLATLAGGDLELDVKSAELNLANSKEALKSAGTDKQNAIKAAKASVDSAALEVETARRQYDETKAQVEKNPSAAVLSAQADLKTAERQLAISRSQAEGQAGSAVLSARKEVEIAQRQYDLLKKQTEQQAGSSLVSAKKELEIAQRQYDTLKNQTQGTPGNTVLSAKKELDIAQRTYDQLTSQGDYAPAVQSARKDLEVADRAYKDSQQPTENTAAVKAARSDLNAAINRYSQLQKGKPLSEQAALNRYNSTIDALNQTQTSAAARVNQASVDLQNADRDYRAALQQYEASKTTDEPQGDPALKTAADQALSAFKDKQAALLAATQSQADSVKAAQDSVSSSNFDYRQAVEGSADALEQARLAAERAQMSYDAAIKNAADTKTSAKDTWERATQAYNVAVSSTNEARVNAADALEKSKQAYEAALGGAADSLVVAQDTLEKAQQAYDNAAGSSKDALVAAQDTLDKTKQAYETAAGSAKEAYAASQESLDKLKIGYESALKNQSEAFATAASALKRAENGYESAQLNKQIAESKTEESARLAIELQEVSLEKLRKQLADTVVKAPISGTVTFKNAVVDQFANGLMFTVEDTGKLTVSAVVSESDIGSLKAGQKAFVKTESTGEEDLNAKLVHIGASAVKSATGETAANTSVQFAADVNLLQADPRIRIGMNARMTVVLESKPNVFSVPLDALATGASGEEIVYVLANDKLREVPVKTGLQNDVMIEIEAPGLADGTTIVSYAQEASDLLQASPELKEEAVSDDPDA